MATATRPDSVASDFTKAVNTPLPLQNEDVSLDNLFLDPPNLSLDPPRASYLASEFSNNRDSSYVQSTPNFSAQGLTVADKTERDEDEAQAAPPVKGRSPRLLWIVGAAALVVVILIIILPVYFTVIKPNQRNVSSATKGSGSSGPAGTPDHGNPQSPSGATSGGDGSTILLEDGTSFTYSNKFGGYWVYDPNDPFNNNARPNSWTPPLNTSWTWGKDRIYGVNIGGLFVLEPFISPALFQKYPDATDEWSLSTLMAADTASGGLNQLEEHYNTFITEKDIAQIAGAGLNWIRLPIPFWAIETWAGEPFLAKTSWKYILRLFGWARKYGLRIKLDLHTIPGSQNGYNHSGKGGQVNFLNGIMGIANAQRTLNYIRIITEFISQDQYKDVVPMFGIINEALITTIGKEQMTSFYLEAHNMIRDITGYGEGHGPYISIHDGFTGISGWAGFLPGSDRIALDTHPYFAFSGSPNDDPIAVGTGSNAGGIWPRQACESWASGINRSQSAFGVTIAGEFSNGYNDCGLFLKGVRGTASYGGDCSLWEDSSNWNQTVKDGVRQFALASMDALQDWFFWTWKIGNSSVSNKVESPLWSYQLGLENDFMPLDPREASGKCAALGVSGSAFDGTYESWQTGGAGAGTISAGASVAWPPAISGAGGGVLPTYTPTGTVATLPPPTLTATTKSVNVGNGWFNAQDTASAPTEVAGCTYPNAWDPVGGAVPASCGRPAGAVAPATTADTAATTTDVAVVTTAVPGVTTAVPGLTTTGVRGVTTSDVETSTRVGAVPTDVARRSYGRPQ